MSQLRSRVTISIRSEKTRDSVRLILEPENLRQFLNVIKPWTKPHRLICEAVAGRKSPSKVKP